MARFMTLCFCLHQAYIIHLFSIEACPCYTPYVCAGVYTAITTCEIRAYKAAFGGATTSFSGDVINVYGAFACNSISSITSNTLICSGRDSCSNTSIQSNTLIHCNGMNSCGFSAINVHPSAALKCSSYLSCRNSVILMEDGSVINARGSLSMYQAIIETPSTNFDTIKIDFDGTLSGFGATLICTSGDTCNINCNSYDSCYMLYIQCDGTCNVAGKALDYTIAPITDSALINSSLIASVAKHFNSQSIIPTNDALCTNDIRNFDNNKEYKNGGVITVDQSNGEPVCCRAYESCYNVTFEFQSNNDLICGGRSACGAANINTHMHGNIYCEGHRGCHHSVISDANDVYCTGGFSCSTSTIVNANNIVCSGQDSCATAKMISNGNNVNIYMVGRASAVNAIIYCNVTDTCYVYCSGYRACENTLVDCAHNCNIECTEQALWCPQVTNRPTMNPTHNPTMSQIQETLYPSSIPIETTSEPSSYPLYNRMTTTSYHTSHPLVITAYSLTSFPTFLFEETDELQISTEITYITSSKNRSIIVVILISIMIVLVCLAAICGAIFVWLKFCHEEKTQELQAMDGEEANAPDIIDVKLVKKVQFDGAELQYTNEGNDDFTKARKEGHQIEQMTQYDDKYSICMQCGDRSKQRMMQMDEMFVCNTCRRLSSSIIDKEVNEMFKRHNDKEAEGGTANGAHTGTTETCGFQTQCVDCGEVKSGKIYDRDGLLYCNECYDYYMNDGETNGNTTK